MEISANSAVTASNYQQQANTQEQAQVSMLKKAINAQAAGALALIESLPTPPANSGLPSNLGNNINVKA